MADEACTIGVQLNDVCHKTSYVQVRGKKRIWDLSEEDQQIILLRTGIETTFDSDICFHHEQVYLVRYEMHASCCNPFKIHKKKVKNNLRVVTFELYKKLVIINLKVIPGQKVCVNCLKKWNALLNSSEECEQCSDSSNEVESPASDVAESTSKIQEKEIDRQQLDNTLTELGCSPLKLHALSSHRKKLYVKRKLKQAHHVFRSKVSRILEIKEKSDSFSDFKDDADDELAVTKSKAKDLDAIVELIKNRLPSANYREKIQLLTFAPPSWTRAKVSITFNVSEYLVRQARAQLERKGIGALPEQQHGKTLPEETVNCVRKFYLDDENSRIMPGAKDKVSIHKNVYEQKRLILCNLRELHSSFVFSEPQANIGFSKFCQLRPKQCVLPGSPGTHSVCVCTIHQNAELLANAICGLKKASDLLEMMVCSKECRSCMLGRCLSCPGSEAVESMLLEKFKEDEEIQFSQWVSTDRSQLITQYLPASEVIDLLKTKLEALLSHSYIAKAQSRYLKQCKEHMTSDNAIILMDFAENYKFVLQDEVQSYHWSSTSCTLHPVVVYYKEHNELCNVSLCIISDDLNHDVPLVYEVQSKVMVFLKQKLPNIKSVLYFTDGCAAEYKNCKNFYNLCCHKQDFDVEASWAFFATSHGKSPCDGIGGTVKRLVARSSLQRPYANQIMTANHMYEFCTSYIQNINFIFIQKASMDTVRDNLKERFKVVKTITGTRSFHHFMPISPTSITMKRISEDENIALTFQFESDTSIDCEVYLKQLATNSYICCVYDSHWYVGLVHKVEETEGDVCVKFLHPQGPALSFYWPQREDKCWVPVQHILCVIDTPTTITGRQYKLNKQSTELIERKWLSYHKNLYH